MNPENAPSPYTCEVCGEDRYADRCDGCDGLIPTADHEPDFDDPEQRGRWKVTGDKTASWALGKLADARREQDRLKANAADLIESVQFQLGMDLKPVEDRAAFFEGCLIEYRYTLEEANPQLPKSYKLPNGVLKRRAGRRSTHASDPEALMAWLMEHGHSDAVKVEPRVSVVKELFPELTDPESGERLPGVEFLMGDDSYSVETY
jgi:phage host-nuclease inhibitor protein Gam